MSNVNYNSTIGMLGERIKNEQSEITTLWHCSVNEMVLGLMWSNILISLLITFGFFFSSWQFLDSTIIRMIRELFVHISHIERIKFRCLQDNLLFERIRKYNFNHKSAARLLNFINFNISLILILSETKFHSTHWQVTTYICKTCVQVSFYLKFTIGGSWS